MRDARGADNRRRLALDSLWHRRAYRADARQVAQSIIGLVTRFTRLRSRQRDTDRKGTPDHEVLATPRIGLCRTGLHLVVRPTA